MTFGETQLSPSQCPSRPLRPPYHPHMISEDLPLPEHPVFIRSALGSVCRAVSGRRRGEAGASAADIQSEWIQGTVSF